MFFEVGGMVYIRFLNYSSYEEGRVFKFKFYLCILDINYLFNLFLYVSLLKLRVSIRL